MNRVVCPHCRSGRLAESVIPKDVVIVKQCPACGELVVMFRRKVLALDRKILERGTSHERKMHIAGIIAEFLEPGLLKFAAAAADFEPDEDEMDADDAIVDGAPAKRPISEDELRDFARVQLRQIDNREYFKRHLG
jgi:hypothetical protein